MINIDMQNLIQASETFRSYIIAGFNFNEQLTPHPKQLKNGFPAWVYRKG